MKKIIYALLLFAGTVEAQIVTYNQHYDDITNPERGYYYYSISWDPSATDHYLPIQAYEVSDCNTKKLSLIQRIIRLDDYRNGGVITPAFLTKLAGDFTILRNAGLKCILRFSYSDSDSSIISPNTYDATEANIHNHIVQLRAITQANEDVISSMEAGFIGKWGEWYYTTNFGSEPLNSGNITARTNVANDIMTMTPNRMVAFRTPFFQKLLAPNFKPLKFYPRYSGSIFSRVAAHNDAFMHDIDDSGTYDNLADRDYLKTKSATTFTGGESNNFNFDFATCLNDYSPAVNTIGRNAIQQMEDYHYNYLNYSTDLEIMSTNTDSYPETGHWFTTTYPSLPFGNCLNEVKRRLGYRFILEQTNLTPNPNPTTFSVRIRNLGFGNVFNSREVYLVLKSSTNVLYRVSISGPNDSEYPLAPGVNTDLCAWSGGATINLSRNLNNVKTISPTPGVPVNTTVPAGTYAAYLEFPDDVSTNLKNWIRIASKTTSNVDIWEPLTGYNNLFRNIPITVSSPKMLPGDITAFEVISSPNPFKDSFKLNITTSSEESITIKVYDMLGKLIEDSNIEASQLESLEIGSKLATGIYNVVVKQGINEKTVRVIKN